MDKHFSEGTEEYSNACKYCSEGFFEEYLKYVGRTQRTFETTTWLKIMVEIIATIVVEAWESLQYSSVTWI